MSLRASATAGAKPKAGAKKATATATATTDAVADVLLPSLGNLRLGGKKPAATDLGVMGFEVHSGNTEGGMENMDPASPYGWVNVAEALSQHGGRVPNAPSAVRLSQQPDAFDTGLNVALRFGATYALPDVATWPRGGCRVEPHGRTVPEHEWQPRVRLLRPDDASSTWQPMPRRICARTRSFWVECARTWKT